MTETAVSDRRYAATQLQELFRRYLARTPEGETPVNEQQSYSHWYYETEKLRQFQPAEHTSLTNLLKFAVKVGVLPENYHEMSFADLREALTKELTNNGDYK